MSLFHLNAGYLLALAAVEPFTLSLCRALFAAYLKLGAIDQKPFSIKLIALFYTLRFRDL